MVRKIYNRTYIFVLGDYIVTHEVYSYMVEHLQHLANGKLVLILEGGYNSTEIGNCLKGCVETLLGQRKTNLEVGEPCKRALQTLSSRYSMPIEILDFITFINSRADILFFAWNIRE